ncbi:NAD(P)-dependent oxidoreductase [Serinicoccus kebangsaanensis]|uniref:NAD(P)-dependent oxidoreductase n=1 Tax=Serinicoccus kebangsaanensis TaxID=2602069 RepID=UPI00124EE0A0|nr:NAD(P)-binding domain-containing protein [Serinicoccus kebangsaanensis]
MRTVSFVGLGVMGRPMAVNLVRSGFDVRAFTRTAESRDRARQDGVPVVDALTELHPDPDVVVTMLPDGPDVRAVLLADDLPLGTSSLVVDMSTIDPAVSREVAAELGARGHRVLDAPVSGGEQGAIDAVLSIMVGGREEDHEEALPVLEALGSTVVRVGETGSGQVVKAANQLIVAGNLQLIAEALVFLEAHGVELGAAVDVLGGGLAGSTALHRKRDAFLQQDYTPGFRAALHDKDLRIAHAAAGEAGVVLPVGGVVQQLMRSLVTTGDGGLDHSALHQVVRRLSGREPPRDR